MNKLKRKTKNLHFQDSSSSISVDSFKDKSSDDYKHKI